ncbi:MAG: hydrogenase expression/formation protein HypE [Melioribacteraceae bacterium]|nr:hydrogenase expression/formation protein HypE [Melioribacteraceae bacterium]
MRNITLENGFNCPLPINNYDTIQLAHGSGGRLTSELIDEMFVKTFGNEVLNKMEDQASLKLNGNEIVFTTDSFVVDPIFFPGGNIGELAINGTVNDLCMNGATPLYLSVAFILEEGLKISDLFSIVLSMKKAADEAGVKIVTGDTKVVNKGQCDKIYINTSGIGVRNSEVDISASNLKVGDKIIVSGTIADHGMSIMTSREGLSFQNDIMSDTVSLNDLVKSMIETTKNIHAMRDPTRSGVAATLNEFAKQSDVGININAEKIPIKPNVKGACEILGIDPLFVANEGKLIAVVAAEHAENLLQIMRAHRCGKDSEIIGEVVNEHRGVVVKKTILGVEQIVDLPLGEQLPRIC